MSVRREAEQSYSSFYTSLKNFLYNSSGENIGGVAIWGSRTTGRHRDHSDLDVIFWIVGNPNKQKVYDDLLVKVKKTLIEVINLRKDDITEADLKQALEKNMGKYLSDSGGATPEGNSIGVLVDEVWKIWTRNGQNKFEEYIIELKDRKRNYFKSNRYAEFLKDEYDMDANSRFVKNARDFQVLLLNEEISGSTRDLYVTSKELEYMKRIVSGGSFQTSLVNFIFTFNVETSHFIQLEYMKWLEQKIWKI